MASRVAVGRAMATLARAFAGVVDDAKIDVYSAAWDDLTDEQLLAAMTVVCRQWEGAFIPPPAVIRRAVAPAESAVDGGKFVRQISKLGTYNANVGWIYPSVERVRDELGESVAYAYSAAGRERLFADDDTTRSIAQREFDQALLEAAAKGANGLPVLTPAENDQKLTESSRPRLMS